ncbi:ABC transporter ATP-binding protein [Lacibacterium aquatile]|uniref:ABC transporter ATP-binding protein n=1 Tax=Lacibacterium aquatile TaxID=1168082 RepID=A0ABW5DV04_9PROT
MSALLSIAGLGKTYRDRHGQAVHALRDVDLELARGETLGIVGESGCGKSTLGRCVVRLIEANAGEIRLDGQDVTKLDGPGLLAYRRAVQIVFQDPSAALNPRHTIGEIIGEPLAIHGIGDRASRKAEVARLIERVGLAPEVATRYPHEVSGGQRQRISIARAIALKPRIVVADEAVSALDVSIQAQILTLLTELQREEGIAFLFISHDIGVIRHVSDRVAVMYLGRIVETGSAAELLANPAHPYTKALLAAVPDPARRGKESGPPLKGDLPDPANPPPGCVFQTRCPVVEDRCRVDIPALVTRRTAPSPRLVACHLIAEA